MKTNIVLKGDMFELIKQLPDKSQDFILTDPPYGIDTDMEVGDTEYDYNTYNGDWDEVLDFSPDIYRVLKNNAVACVFANQNNLFENGMQLKQNDFEIINIIKWIKPDASPNISKKYLKHDTEFIIVARKGDTNYFNYDYSLVCEDLYSKSGHQLSETWITGKTKGGYRKLHPTQKPEWIIERLLMLYTRQNDLVLDCFCGSGTIGYMCRKLNRRFILMEREKEFYDTSVERIAEIDERYNNNLKEFLE